MHALDAFLLTRVFSPIAWFIERRTGKNNFRQAEWCLYASAVGSPVWVFELFLIRNHELWFLPMMALPSIAWIWICFHAVMIVREREQNCARYQNYLDVFEAGGAMVGVRITGLGLFLSLDSILLASDSVDLHGWMLLTGVIWYYNLPNAAAHYLMSVRRPPPQKRRQRDWFWFLRPLPVPI